LPFDLTKVSQNELAESRMPFILNIIDHRIKPSP